MKVILVAGVVCLVAGCSNTKEQPAVLSTQQAQKKTVTPVKTIQIGDFLVPQIEEDGWHRQVVKRNGMIQFAQEQRTSGSNVNFDFNFYPTPKGRKPRTERQMLTEVKAFLREVKSSGDPQDVKILVSKPTKFNEWPAHYQVIDHMTPLANSKEYELSFRTWAMDIVDGRNHYLIHASVIDPDEKSLSEANTLWNRMLKEIRHNPQPNSKSDKK